MIIIKRHRAWNGTIELALCEELRRTDKRVYARYVAGDSYALDGQRERRYCGVGDILTINGTLEQLADMIEARGRHMQTIAAMKREIACEQEAFNRTLVAIAAE